MFFKKFLDNTKNCINIKILNMFNIIKLAISLYYKVSIININI